MNENRYLDILKMGYEQQRSELRRTVNSFYTFSSLLIIIGMAVYLDIFSNYREKAFLGLLFLILLWITYSVHYHFERKQLRFTLYLYEHMINKLVGFNYLFMETGFNQIISGLEFAKEKQKYETGQTVRRIHKVLAILFFLFVIHGAVSLVSSKKALLVLFLFIGFFILLILVRILIRRIEEKINKSNEELIKTILGPLDAEKK